MNDLSQQPESADAEVRAAIVAEEERKAQEEISASRGAVRKTWLTRLAIAVAIIGLGWGIHYLLIGRNHVNTDNAYVNAEVAQVTPLISATATRVHVRDTQFVKAGTVLVELDPANARIAVAQAEAELAEAQRRFRQARATNSALSAQVSAREADIMRTRAQLAAAQADLEKARVDLQRRQSLAGTGAVSGDELTSARKAYAAAQAAVAASQAAVSQAQATRTSAQGELAASSALVSGSTDETDPAVLAAKARLAAAQLDVERTTIRAPIDGVVTRRQVQVGQRVAQGAPIMTIVPLDRVYVDANFKERQLRRVRVGMPAEVTADIYGGGTVYHGKVVGIAGGTGASMAIIPAQNASGNWIKVVQRVPVRIQLDPKELAAHPLRVGLSTEVTIDVSGN
ncbi:MAG: HlyD family efflux transporter periplasmic adaptor subunit [Novosphingobium sp.]|nr:HlyD family efflux transporter periplasmic adaptor subunit [Novosphingobium sp.]